MGKQIKNTEESIKLLKVITETKENLIAIIREIVGERKVEINLSIRQPFEDTMYGSVEELYVSELYFNEDEDCIIVLDDEYEREEHFLLDEGLDFIKSVCQKVVSDIDK